MHTSCGMAKSKTWIHGLYTSTAPVSATSAKIRKKLFRKIGFCARFFVVPFRPSGSRSTNEQVEISSVTWRDWDTGEEADFAGVNCGAFYYDGGVGAGTTTACILGGSGGETIASGVDVEEGCKNALASICYTVSIKSLEYPPLALWAAALGFDSPLGNKGNNEKLTFKLSKRGS